MRGLFCFLLSFIYSCYGVDHFYDTSGIFSTVNEEIALLREGRFLHAYTSLTNDVFKDQTSFNDFLLFISKISPLHNNVSHQLGFTKIEDQIGIYEGEICDKEGEKMAIHFGLKREKTRWLIESMIVYPIVTRPNPIKKNETSSLKRSRF